MNTSRQLTDLIKNKARALCLDAQLLLKRYFMEQMLARIAKSEYKTNFILRNTFGFIHFDDIITYFSIFYLSFYQLNDILSVFLLLLLYH